jgi:hypothetical protein
MAVDEDATVFSWIVDRLMKKLDTLGTFAKSRSSVARRSCAVFRFCAPLFGGISIES